MSPERSVTYVSERTKAVNFYRIWLGRLPAAEQQLQEHPLGFELVFSHLLRVDLKCRLQTLAPEHFLHQLRIDLHLDQDRSESPSERMESESTRRSHDSRLLGSHAQVIGNQHVG